MTARLLTVAIGTLALAATPAMAQPSRCSAAKVDATGKSAMCRLSLEAKEAAGKPKDPADVQRCEDKLVDSFARADTRYSDCRANGEVNLVIPVIDTFVDDVDDALTVGLPGSGCQKAKLQATGRKARCLLKAYARSVATAGPLEPKRVQKCHDKLVASFAKAETRPDCATTGDADDIENEVDMFATDIQDAIVDIDPPPSTTTSTISGGTTTTTFIAETCCGSLPSLLSFTVGMPPGTATGQVSLPRCVDGTNPATVCSSDAHCLGGGVCRGHLDAGALYLGGGTSTGVATPLAVPDGGRFFSKMVTCASPDALLSPATAAEVPSGPSTPPGTPTYGQRHCTSPGCLFGPPLKIVRTDPSRSLCAIPTIDNQPGVGTGLLTCYTGGATVSLPQSWELYLTGPTLGAQACPICVGGLCSGGARDGQSCTPETSGPAPTSHDCPPSASTFVGSTPFGLTLTTTNQTRTAITTASQNRVFCGFCFDPTLEVYESPPRACTDDASCTAMGFTSCRQHSTGAFRNLFATTLSETGADANTMISSGAPQPATLVSLFCLPPTYATSIDDDLGLPGPGAVSLQGTLQFIP